MRTVVNSDLRHDKLGWIRDTKDASRRVQDLDVLDTCQYHMVHGQSARSHGPTWSQKF